MPASDQAKEKKELISQIEALRRENDDLRRAEASRRQAARALRRSEKRLKLTFDQSPVGAVLIGAENEFLEANARFCDFLGYSPKELASLTVLAVTYPDDREDSRASMKGLLDGKVDQIRQYEKRYVRKDGAVVWGRVSARPLRDRQGRILFRLAMVEDITERKITEEALRKSQALLAETQRITKLGGWEYDLREKRITFTKETYLIHEIPEDFDPNNIDKNISFYGPQAQATIKDAFWRAVYEGAPYDLELPFTTAKGKKLWVRTMGRPVREDGEVVRVVGNIMDITQRKEAELEREKLISQLQKALAEVKKLSGLLPICASCKKIRNDQGYWEQIETYIGSRSEADFSHGICPECRKKLYPELEK